MRSPTITYRTATALILAALLVGACSTDDTAPQRDADRTKDADEARAGTLLAEYTQPRSGQAGGLSVHAQFLDVQGVQYDTALEALEVWSPDWELSQDTCNLRSEPSVSQAAADEIRMELLDVGPITVRGPHETIELEARRLPDLLSAFSGVIYGTDQSVDTRPLQLGFESGARYDFDAPGASDAGEFAVSLHSPEPIQIEAIGDHVLKRAGYVGWPFGSDLALHWRPEAGEQSADALFLHISSGFGPDRPRMTCRLDDDGSFVIPGAILEQLSEDTSELELALRRVNTESVDIDGLETSEFIFSTVDEVTLVDE